MELRHAGNRDTARAAAADRHAGVIAVAVRLHIDAVMRGHAGGLTGLADRRVGGGADQVYQRGAGDGHSAARDRTGDQQRGAVVARRHVQTSGIDLATGYDRTGAAVEHVDQHRTGTTHQAAGQTGTDLDRLLGGQRLHHHLRSRADIGAQHPRIGLRIEYRRRAGTRAGEAATTGNAGNEAGGRDMAGSAHIDLLALSGKPHRVQYRLPTDGRIIPAAARVTRIGGGIARHPARQVVTVDVGPPNLGRRRRAHLANAHHRRNRSAAQRVEREGAADTKGRHFLRGGGVDCHTGDRDPAGAQIHTGVVGAVLQPRAGDIATV